MHRLKLTAIVLLFLLPIIATADLDVRHLYAYSDTTIVPEPENIAFYQYESVLFDVTITSNSFPYNLSNTNLFGIWEVYSTTSPVSAFIVVTSSVLNATSGVIRFTLSPTDTSLYDGRYSGLVRLFERDGSTLVKKGVLVRQMVDVRFAPNSDNYNFVGPVWWNIFDPANFSVTRIIATRGEFSEIRLGGVLCSVWPTNWPFYYGANVAETYSGDSVGLYSSGGGSGSGNIFFYWKNLAVDGGLSIYETQGVVVVSGSPSNGILSNFPVPTNTTYGAIYYRSRATGWPFKPLYLTAADSNKYLCWKDTGGFVLDSSIAATNADNFAGQPPAYYDARYFNSANATNFQLWDGSTIQTPNLAALEAGDNLDVETYQRTNGTYTTTVYRINAAGTNNTGNLVTSNRWTEYNEFEEGITVNDRIVLRGDNNTMSGGGATTSLGGSNNTASGNNSTIAGGYHNDAGGDASTIAGGYDNTASGSKATIAGGQWNRALGSYSTIAGGYQNYARSSYSAVLGGSHNDAGSGLLSDYATILGGDVIRNDSQFGMAAGEYLYLHHQRNFVYGFGISSTQYVESVTQDVFAVVNLNTNTPMKLGVNTMNPRGAIDAGTNGDVYARFFYGTVTSTDSITVAGGGVIITNGREAGMFVKYAGGGNYTHDWSSVRTIIGPTGTTYEVWTNSPVDTLEFAEGSNVTIELFGLSGGYARVKIHAFTNLTQTIFLTNEVYKTTNLYWVTNFTYVTNWTTNIYTTNVLNNLTNYEYWVTNLYYVTNTYWTTNTTWLTNVYTTNFVYTNLYYVTNFTWATNYSYVTNVFTTNFVYTNLYYVTNFTYVTNFSTNYTTVTNIFTTNLVTTNIYFVTNTVNIYSTNTYGDTDSTAYRGDWGAWNSNAVNTKASKTNWFSATDLAVGGDNQQTVLITRAGSGLFLYRMSNTPVTVDIDIASWAETAEFAMKLNIWVTTNPLAWVNTAFRNYGASGCTTNFTVTSNALNSFVLLKDAGTNFPAAIWKLSPP